TSWSCSGCRARSLLARLLGPFMERPAQAISTLVVGPVACEARLQLSHSAAGADAFPVVPNGSAPLKRWLARPSQKLFLLNTAPIALGALRCVTRRCPKKGALECGSQRSSALLA